jgi:hypothetical protein
LIQLSILAGARSSIAHGIALRFSVTNMKRQVALVQG